MACLWKGRPTSAPSWMCLTRDTGVFPPGLLSEASKKGFLRNLVVPRGQKYEMSSRGRRRRNIKYQILITLPAVLELLWNFWALPGHLARPFLSHVRKHVLLLPCIRKLHVSHPISKWLTSFLLHSFVPWRPKQAGDPYLSWASRWRYWWRTHVPNQETWNVGSIPGSGRSSGRRHDNPLQYPCLENLMDGGVHGITKGQTQPKWLSTHTPSPLEKLACSQRLLL